MSIPDPGWQPAIRNLRSLADFLRGLALVLAENSIRPSFGAARSPALPVVTPPRPFISMVESSHFRELDHLAQLGPMYAPGLWGIADQ